MIDLEQGHGPSHASTAAPVTEEAPASEPCPPSIHPGIGCAKRRNGHASAAATDRVTPGYSGTVKLYREERGRRDARDALLLLHGLGSSSADWAFQMPEFEQRHRVILIDLPGHGRSPLPARRSTIEDMAAALEVTLDSLGAPSVHALGLSLGGCVALGLALHAPARVRSLTLVNAFARLWPAGLRGAGRMAVRLALLAAAPMTAVAAHVARGLFPHPDQRDLYAAAVASLSRTSRAGYLAGVRALARFDARTRLAALRCPTLIV